jgi:hypothetical protein
MIRSAQRGLLGFLVDTGIASLLAATIGLRRNWSYYHAPFDRMSLRNRPVSWATVLTISVARNYAINDLRLEGRFPTSVS